MLHIKNHMKNQMIRLAALVLLGGFVAFGPTTQAAERPHKERPATRQRGQKGDRADRAGGLVKKLTEQLSLSAEQVQKLKTVLKEQGQKMAKIRKDSSLSAEEKRAAFRKNRTAINAAIKKILTPEQQKKFEALMAKRGPQARGEKGDKQGKRGPKPDKPRKSKRAK